MVAIDSAVLDLTEWLCRKFQRLTGRTNVWLAVQFTNISVVLYFVWVYFVWSGVYFAAIGPYVRGAVGAFCAAVLYGLSQTVFRVSIETAESNAYARVARGLRNPRRLRDAPLRISFLTLSVFWLIPFLFVWANFRSTVALLGYQLVLLTTVVLYVIACDPLPPCVGWLTEWLRRFTPTRVPDAQPTGDPSRFAVCSLRRATLWEMAVRTCTVSFADRRGIRHGVDVEAESLYEAAVLAIQTFREDPWLPPITPETVLDVEVRMPATKHSLTFQQVERWLAGAPASPNEAMKKAKLKLILVQG